MAATISDAKVVTLCVNPARDDHGDGRQYWGGGGQNFTTAAVAHPGATPGTLCLITFRGELDDDLEPQITGLRNKGVELHITKAAGRTRTVRYLGGKGVFGQSELEISAADLQEALSPLAQVHHGQHVVITGSLIPDKTSALDYSNSVYLAHRLGATRWLDTHGDVVAQMIGIAKAEAHGYPELMRMWLPDYLKVNIEEACDLFRPRDPDNYVELTRAASSLLPQTTVLITLGPKGGALVCEPRRTAEQVWIDSPHELPYDNNVACGDAFFAWVVMGVINGKGLRRSVAEGLGAADANTTTRPPAEFPVELALTQAGYAQYAEVK